MSATDVITALGKGQTFRKKRRYKPDGQIPVPHTKNLPLKRHVPPPDGEMARFTIDFFK